MKWRTILLGCLLAAGLAGCSKDFGCSMGILHTGCYPQIDVQTTHVEPTGKAGKLCIAQCRQANMVCESTREMSLQSCRSQELTRAQAEYRSYLYSLPRDMNKKKIKTFSDFDRKPNCESNLPCFLYYRDCFKSCGGRIEEQRFCVADCHLMTPPVPNGTALGPKTTL
ncbi:hypothetical protein [Azospirillum brasilense]|nr:hypothetical protein [Azospirillum brasilense]